MSKRKQTKRQRRAKQRRKRDQRKKHQRQRQGKRDPMVEQYKAMQGAVQYAVIGHLLEALR